MARHDTWMPLYVGDYLADTLHLTTRQHGAYLLLLMHAWRNGGNIPTTEAAQAAVARMPVKEWAKDAEIVLEFFDFDPEGKDGIWHQRVRDELAVAEAMTQQRSKAGKASAAKRERERQRNGNEISTPVERPLDSRTKPSQSQSPSPDLTTIPSVANSAPVGASQSAKSKLIPDDYEPSAEDRAVLLKEMPWLEPMWDKRVAEFRDWCIANATRTFNPAATFRGFMRQTRQPRVTGNKPGGVTGNGRTHTASDDNWPWRLTKWREDKFWLATWGPEPGKPGCFVPREFLQ